MIITRFLINLCSAANYFGLVRSVKSLSIIRKTGTQNGHPTEKTVAGHQRVESCFVALQIIKAVLSEIGIQLNWHIRRAHLLLNLHFLFPHAQIAAF